MRVTIEKLVFGGQGLGRLEDGRVVFVWNALPGEVVDIQIITEKKNYLEGVATTIITPSPKRQSPIVDAYLSSAAWDMMNYETECHWKVAMVKEVYKKVGNLDIEDLSLVADERYYGYRNKIEFSFCDKNFIPKDKRPAHHVEDISLAFFGRGSRERIPVTTCALATPAIQEVTARLLAFIKEQGIPNRTLKSLIVRSNRRGQVIAGLFIKDLFAFSSYPDLDDTLVGFHVYYSSHKSPASRPDDILYSEGTSTLSETIRDIPFEYGLFSFFQVNPPLFEKTLADIERFVDNDVHLIDFYAGVGAIGLSLADKAKSLLLVDNNEEAIGIAKKAILAQGLTHCTAEALPAEKMLDCLTSDAIVIVDPPRTGLHPDVTAKLAEVQPKRIIYLSCDIATQARDIALLSSVYNVSFSRLYNYFPRTPHVEGLCILEKKS